MGFSEKLQASPSWLQCTPGLYFSSTHIHLQIPWTGNPAALCQPCPLLVRDENSLLRIHCLGLSPPGYVTAFPRFFTAQQIPFQTTLVSAHFSYILFTAFFSLFSSLCPLTPDCFFSSPSLQPICEPKNYPDHDQ